MSRPIVLSNGSMHVGINCYGLVHDFYYPYVGGENHAAANALRHRIGLWVDGEFSWIDDGSWQQQFRYLSGTLIGLVAARSEQLGLSLEFMDAVDAQSDVFMRTVHVINHRDSSRNVRIFFHQVFVISNSRSSDTIQFIPDSHALLHYKGRRYFMVGGTDYQDKPFDQYAIGAHGIEGHEGVYRDAEDGELSGNNVEHGRVDSVLRFSLHLEAHDSSRVNYWIAAGTAIDDAMELHRLILSDGITHRLVLTDNFWRKWSQRARHAADKLPIDYQESFLQSVLLIKSHIDNHGGVIASTDTTMLSYWRDAYAYCWPRDAAHALWPLLRLGYKDELLNFFDFARRALRREGYLMHKYQPDGAVGSSWHPYVHEGEIAPPIQEDESAIVVFLFARYFAMHKDRETLEKFYPSLIRPIANFMSQYFDDTTGLPKPSYDLWERLYLTTTYTTALVYGSLLEAAELADILHETDDALRWRTIADTIKASSVQLYDSETGCFIKGLRREGSTIIRDTTVDISSVYGAYMFNLYDISSPEIRSSLEVCKRQLKTSDNHPGLARFANDEYLRYDPSRVGNPWFVASLWIAQHAYETDDPDTAGQILSWVKSRMMSTGVLSEQFDPDNLSFISVAPLTWSQAEYVNCLLDSLPGEEHIHT